MAIVIGPLTVLPGLVTQTLATPAALVGIPVTLRWSISDVSLPGEVALSVFGSADGVSWTILSPHGAHDLLVLNDLGVSDTSIAEVPFPRLPAQLKLALTSSAAFSLTVESV